MGEEKFQVEEFINFHKILVYFLGRNFVLSDIVDYGNGVLHGLNDLDLVDIAVHHYLFETMISWEKLTNYLDPEFKETVGRILDNTNSYFESLGIEFNFENFRKDFVKRLLTHDDSKLENEELEQNKQYLPSYLAAKEESVTSHTLERKLRYPHRKENRHHPEYFAHGIKDMNVLDLLEMLIDIVAHALLEDKKITTVMIKLRDEYEIEPGLYAILFQTVLHSFGYFNTKEERETVLETVAKMVKNTNYSILEEGKKEYGIQYKKV